MSIDTGAVLVGHSYMQTERPPLLWDIDADDYPFFRLLGFMIVLGLHCGNELSELTLKADNLVIEDSGPPYPGNYVALTVSGAGEWPPEQTWPLDEGTFVSEDLHLAAASAVMPFGYTRVSGSGGSITVLFPAATSD